MWSPSVSPILCDFDNPLSFAAASGSPDTSPAAGLQQRKTPQPRRGVLIVGIQPTHFSSLFGGLLFNLDVVSKIERASLVLANHFLDYLTGFPAKYARAANDRMRYWNTSRKAM